MINAVLLNNDDMVATMTSAVYLGNDITFIMYGKTMVIKAISNVPIYHKVAVRAIEKGEAILKYGEKIGYATADIKEGEHVHTQNLSSRL